MSEFDNEDSGAVLECVEGISRNVPIDGSESVQCPIVLCHEVLAESGAVGSVSKSCGEASSDGFTMDGEASLGGGNEWN